MLFIGCRNLPKSSHRSIVNPIACLDGSWQARVVATSGGGIAKVRDNTFLKWRTQATTLNRPFWGLHTVCVSEVWVTKILVSRPIYQRFCNPLFATSLPPSPSEFASKCTFELSKVLKATIRFHSNLGNSKVHSPFDIFIKSEMDTRSG